MKEIILRTQTSAYKLERIYRLTKLSLAPKQTSMVTPGMSFTGEAYISRDTGILFVGDMHTSPVQNSEEVAKFLKQEDV